jgi:hypothetical protein
MEYVFILKSNILSGVTPLYSSKLFRKKNMERIEAVTQILLCVIDRCSELVDECDVSVNINLHVILYESEIFY